MTHRLLDYDPARDGPLADFLFANGVEFPCGGSAGCTRCKVRVVQGDAAAIDDSLTEAEHAAGWRLGCTTEARLPLVIEVAQWSASILGDDAELPVEPVEGFGAVVDVGTTTVVAQRVDLRTGEVCHVASALNAQARHGADLMSRVEFDSRSPGVLTQLIRAQVRRLLAGDEPLEEVLLVGNTVMHHLFCGLSVAPLAAAPFRSPNLDAYHLPIEILGAPATFLPCVGGFVGSDLLAGLVAVDLREGALLDLGTNGEIAVASPDGILCASTAAGPAFEGGRISQGMRAGDGAIDRAEIREGGLHLHVIGGDAARGICGSGLVDVVACALDLGWIGKNGRLADGAKEMPLAPGVRLTQGDIRQLQLAKGAVAAGFRLLGGGRVHLAGAFGNYIRAAGARRIGLLPGDGPEPISSGNTALRGARRLLLVPTERAALLERLLARVRHVELAADPRFEDAYVDAMSFPGKEHAPA